jgi:TRAP-type C4-dicarboxylate transport system permease small subunit
MDKPTSSQSTRSRVLAVLFVVGLFALYWYGSATLTADNAEAVGENIGRAIVDVALYGTLPILLFLFLIRRFRPKR